ncbi:MAG: M14 family zinc carboxypeptidase [Bacteroidota bacterium]
MKNSIAIMLLCILSLSAQERYSQVRIPVHSPAAMKNLVDLGLAVDHYHGKIGSSIDVFLSASEIEILKNNGVSYSILIDNWLDYYMRAQEADLSAAALPADVPAYFRYGSMGGFLTYAEVLQQLDSMSLLFPALITAKDSIGATNEGRAIYALKISDQPGIDESTEPEVLFTALHHAREPQGMTTLIYYMWWLLENYGSNPEATYLVNNRELWFIPVVNPDGYTYNQTIAPVGGGMWRKNRRINDDSTVGVDLNRNYGPEYMWNSFNGGSSILPASEVFRGHAPFSEPETQTIDRFLRSRKINVCFNYHTYGNYLIYPWGYSSGESPDSLLFREWTYTMTNINRYATGTDMQTVQYSTRGNSDDYMYGDTSGGKQPTYAMTPEVGKTGFWPSQSEIYPLAEENLEMNKLLTYFAGHYPFVRRHWYEDTLGNAIPVPRNIFNLRIELGNRGLEHAENLTISVNDPTLMYSFATQKISLLPSLADTLIAIRGTQQNYHLESISFIVNISDSAGLMVRDTLRAFTTTSEVIFSDDATGGVTNWTIGAGWGTISDAYSPPLAFTDSPSGKYAANVNNALTMKSGVDLPPPHNELRFRTKWSIEPVWDFGTVEASTNGGVTWLPLRTQLSRKGSGRSGSKQPAGSFGYDGYNPSVLTSVLDTKKYWIEQSADLSEFNGKTVLIRFRLASDGAEERDGWYLDDIRIIHYNFAPLSVTDIAPVAESFELMQNYPNPFNPTTTIHFSIPQRSRTELSVFDAIGRKISTVVDRELASGSYTATFDARQLSSGIYFYRLEAGSYTATKRMTVLK